MSTDIDTIIIKVVSPCNINCSYCYEYNRGDSSWKDKPKKIAFATTKLIGARIVEYAAQRGVGTFNVNLHGGEPTMLGAQRIDELLTGLKDATSGAALRFGMQSNGTLVTDELVSVLVKHKVRVGVSLDGDIRANKFRVDHQGRSTWKRAVAGLKKLQTAGVLTGIQAVIDLDSDPEVVLDALGGFNCAEIELSQPFANYDNPPTSSNDQRSLGEWLIRAYLHWQSTPALRKCRINLLADALTSILSGRSRSDWFPTFPPGYIIIASDGSYEGLDALKVVGAQGRVLEMNVRSHSISQVLEHPFILARSNAEQLSPECKACAIKTWCAGGFYPTRYGRGRGFDNPSIYCGDLKLLFGRLAIDLTKYPGVAEPDRVRIGNQLAALSTETQHGGNHVGVGRS